MADDAEQSRSREELAEVVRELIQATGLSLKNLSVRTNYSPQSWSAFQRNERPIPSPAVQALFEIPSSAQPALKQRAKRLLRERDEQPQPAWPAPKRLGMKTWLFAGVCATMITALLVGLNYLGDRPASTSTPDSLPEPCTKYRVAPRNVNLRAEDTTPLGVELQHGDLVIVERRIPAAEMALVSAGDGRRGWVFYRYLVTAC